MAMTDLAVVAAVLASPCRRGVGQGCCGAQAVWVMQWKGMKMSRFDCEEQEATAPRIGCGCRACYRARESAVDPRLIELIRYGWSMPGVRVSPAIEVVRRGLDTYLAGRIEWGALYIEIIRALVKQSDEQFDQALSLLNRLPSPFVLLDKQAE